MTLDGYALTGLFVVIFGFLCVTAWIFERAEPDPISGDRRHQAHPATSGATTYAVDHGPARSSLRGSPVADRNPRGHAASE